MITIKESTPEDEADIRYILEHSNNSTIFHTPEWNKLVAEEFGIEMRTLIATEACGKALGLYTFFIKKRGCFKQIKSPLREADSIYGGPIAIEDNPAVIKELILAAKDKGVEYYQIFTPPNYKVELLKDLGYRCRKLWTSIRELHGSEENLWMQIDSKRRNLIRKAQANGVKVIGGDALSDGGVDFVEIYYPMVEDVIKRAGLPIFPQSYYSKVIRFAPHIPHPSFHIKPLLALHQGKPIAGAIFLCFKDTVYYWSGASLKEYRNLAPNDLIQWELMRWALRAGYKYYDLVIVDPERLPGIAHFKLGFGGKLVPIYEAIRRTPLGELARGVRALSHPKKIISKMRKSQ